MPGGVAIGIPTEVQSARLDAKSSTGASSQPVG